MIKVLLPIILALFIAGCGDDDSTKVKVNNTIGQGAGALIVFDSAGGDIPYPNNILFAGSTDGTLNIPYEDTDSDASVKFALNTLDGFSTTSPISISFNGEINPSSLFEGIHVYEMNATGIARELSFYIPNQQAGEYVATTSGNKIVVLPVKALSSNTNYAVVLTTKIVNDLNKPIAPDLASSLLLKTDALFDATGNHTTLSDEDAQTFEGIRQVSQQVIGAVLTSSGNTIQREEIVSAWSFKTQSIGAHFTDVKAEDIAGALQVVDSDLNTSAVGGFGKADIWVGAMANLPYYLGTPSQENPIAPLTNYFVDTNGSPIFSGMPTLQDTKTVPVLMTKPNADSAAVAGGATSPWPIVIFQHGITQNRTNVLAIADALADAGYATIAMDLPLHGLDTNATGLMTNYERTFNVDYVDNTTGAPGSDGVIDASGTHYINLASLLTSRDNMRQSASDLLALKNAISGLSDIDDTRIAFVGHSLGTIASFGFLAHTAMESVTLAMPGSGIAELLNNSPAYAPIIEAGLASKGVMKGTSAYSSFMLATQTVLDDADPINYTAAVATTQTGKLFAIEVVGTDSSNSDQVIPNSVATAPLAGTEPLVQYLGMVNLTGNDTDTVAPSATARFIAGHHSSILRPNAVSGETPTAEEVEVTSAMQTQVATFVGSQGASIPVVNSSLLKP